ncbi:hypothetical protein [Streptomyces lavendulae]|nr:hypothetical protein [Streptomyces lavendulae]
MPEHLARDASPVQAGATEGALVDDDDVEVGEALVDDGVAGAGSMMTRS